MELRAFGRLRKLRVGWTGRRLPTGAIGGLSSIKRAVPKSQRYPKVGILVLGLHLSNYNMSFSEDFAGFLEPFESFFFAESR